MKTVLPPLIATCLGLLFVLATAAAPALAAEPPPRGAAWPCHVIDQGDRGADGTKLADINRDGWPDIVAGWEEDGTTRVYLHPGSGDVRAPWPKVVIGATPAAEDAVFADLDGDGRPDVITCTEGNSQRVFIHWGPAPSALLDRSAWRQEVFPALAKVSRWMYAEPLQMDGRHGVDLVIGGKRGGESSSSVLGWLESPPNPRDLAAWKWHPMITVGWTMTIAPEDMDGDGDADILYSDRFGPTRGIYWLENPGAAATAAGAEWKRHAVGATEVKEVLFISTGDFDGDGLVDIAAAAILPGPAGEPDASSRVLLFRRQDRSGQHWGEQVLRVPSGTGSLKSVAIGDIDGDGRADLVVSCEHAKGDRVGVYWLQPQSPRQAGAPGSAWSSFNISGARGIKFDLARLVDLDRDGDLDVLTTEEQEGGVGLGVVWYENPHRRR